jgi:hypothetical protein
LVHAIDVAWQAVDVCRPLAGNQIHRAVKQTQSLDERLVIAIDEHVCKRLVSEAPYGKLVPGLAVAAGTRDSLNQILVSRSLNQF